MANHKTVNEIIGTTRQRVPRINLRGVAVPRGTATVSTPIGPVTCELVSCGHRGGCLKAPHAMALFFVGGERVTKTELAKMLVNKAG